MNRWLCVWVMGLVVLVSALALAEDAIAPAEDVSQAELLGAIRAGTPDLVLLDVRTPQEYAQGHVPGARNVPVDVVAERLPSLEADRGGDVVVYCRSGKRAARAIDVLRRAGFERVRHLEGDIAGWESAGLPMETGPGDDLEPHR